MKGFGCGILLLVSAVLAMISGVLFVSLGHVFIAKVLFEKVDQCHIAQGDLTIRLYLGSFGATTAYTQLVTVQQGWMPHEQIVFSSYGGIPISALVCRDTSVTFEGELDWSFTERELQTQLVAYPIILQWGEPVPIEDRLSWDPFQIFCGIPLLILGGILGFWGWTTAFRKGKPP